MNQGMLQFEGVIGFGVADEAEAVHFFEHTLGLELSAQDSGLRFYHVRDDQIVTLAVDVSGRSSGEPPYLLFSTDDLERAAEHFLERGCAVRELPWAPGAPGFVARAPEGHSVCVVDAASLAADDG